LHATACTLPDPQKLRCGDTVGYFSRSARYDDARQFAEHRVPPWARAGTRMICVDSGLLTDRAYISARCPSWQTVSSLLLSIGESHLILNENVVNNHRGGIHAP
jgi:hypothetical protein